MHLVFMEAYGLAHVTQVECCCCSTAHANIGTYMRKDMANQSSNSDLNSVHTYVHPRYST